MYIWYKPKKMASTPGIHVKAIPENVFDVILDRQLLEQKKKGRRKVNLSQVVIIMVREAYCKEK